MSGRRDYCQRQSKLLILLTNQYEINDINLKLLIKATEGIKKILSFVKIKDIEG